MEINGIAHVYITVRNFEACAAFYRRLLPFLGLTRIVHDDANTFYCIGGRTGFGLTRSTGEHRDTAFAQDRAGLHHVCFRARSREDVDAVHALVRELGATVVRAPETGKWAPGYYSILFEDLTASASRSTTFPAKASSPHLRNSTPSPIKKELLAQHRVVCGGD